MVVQDYEVFTASHLPLGAVCPASSAPRHRFMSTFIPTSPLRVLKDGPACSLIEGDKELITTPEFDTIFAID